MHLHVCQQTLWVNIGSGNGLWPVRCLTIARINDELLSIEKLRTNLSEI